MMRMGMSQRDRRTLLVGVCSIGSLVAFGRGVPALRSWQEATHNQAAAAASELTAARVALASIATLRDSLRTQRDRIAELDSAFLVGGTPSAAAARMASAIEDMADDAEVKVSAIQLRADSVSVGPLTEVAVRITAVADVFGLLSLMHSIEGGDVLLAIRDLSVSQPEPAAPENKPEALRVDMTIAGLAKIAPEKARGQ